MKTMETTRFFMTQSFTLVTVLTTYNAIFDILDEIQNEDGQIDFKTDVKYNG